MAPLAVCLEYLRTEVAQCLLWNRQLVHAYLSEAIVEQACLSLSCWHLHLVSEKPH